jgi:hypothetical protein
MTEAAIARNAADEACGPFIVWEYYGYEGWHPKSYATLKEALSSQKYNSTWVVTKKQEYDVVEK